MEEKGFYRDERGIKRRIKTAADRELERAIEAEARLGA